MVNFNYIFFNFLYHIAKLFNLNNYSNFNSINTQIFSIKFDEILKTNLSLCCFLIIVLLIILIILMTLSKRPKSYVDAGVQTKQDWDRGFTVDIVYKRILRRNNTYEYFIYNQRQSSLRNIPQFLVRTDYLIQINEPEAVAKIIGNRIYNGVVVNRLPTMQGSEAVFINPHKLRELKRTYDVRSMGNHVIHRNRRMSIHRSLGEDLIEN